MGSMLPYIAAPWIRHGIWILYIKLPDGLIMSRCPDFRCPVDSTTPSDFFRSVVSVRLPRFEDTAGERDILVYDIIYI